MVSKGGGCWNSFAIYSLGVMYQNGRGVSQSYTEAAGWYRKAAEQNNDSAKINLGILYHYGWGVGLDIDTARSFCSQAATSGNQDVAATAAKLVRNLDVPPQRQPVTDTPDVAAEAATRETAKDGNESQGLSDGAKFVFGALGFPAVLAAASIASGNNNAGYQNAGQDQQQEFQKQQENRRQSFCFANTVGDFGVEWVAGCP